VRKNLTSPTAYSLTSLTWENRGHIHLKVCYKPHTNGLTKQPMLGFIRICCEEDPGNNRKDGFQCVSCSTSQKPFIVKGESWRNHKQSKTHSLKIQPIELPEEFHEAELGGVASLILAGIPQPQPSAAIPVDHRVTWADPLWANNSSDLDEPYHAADCQEPAFTDDLKFYFSVQLPHFRSLKFSFSRSLIIETRRNIHFRRIMVHGV